MPGLALRILRHQNLAYHSRAPIRLSYLGDIHPLYSSPRSPSSLQFYCSTSSVCRGTHRCDIQCFRMYLSTHTGSLHLQCCVYNVCCIPVRPSTSYMYSIICTESTLLHLVIPTLPYICTSNTPALIKWYSVYEVYGVQTP